VSNPVGEPTEAGSDPGVAGNSRLTAVNGMVLLILLGVEGLTILSIGQLISWHIYLGVLLVGPVLLKCASTCYRFARYYTGAEPYVRNGPAHPVLRLLGPLVIVSSMAVLGTGVGLIYTGPDHREPLLALHKASFIVWFAATAIHVLGHVLEAGTLTWHELRDSTVAPAARQRRWRFAALALSLIIGVGIASTLYPAARAWTHGQATVSDDSHGANGRACSGVSGHHAPSAQDAPSDDPGEDDADGGGCRFGEPEVSAATAEREWELSRFEVCSGDTDDGPFEVFEVRYADPDDDRCEDDLEDDHQHQGDGALSEQGAEPESDEESDGGFEFEPQPGLDHQGL
jgi:hypothetical protein